MYTITLTAVDAEARGRQKQSTAIVHPEVEWPVSAYGKPTPENLKKFVTEWEKRSRRREARKVTRAVIVRRRGAPRGIVAVYAA